MKYRSFADMSRTIALNLHKIPTDVDLIVGIPRSGLLAGNMVALALNIPIIDLDGYLENRLPRHGFTRKLKINMTKPQDAKHILIVDDTIFSGKTIERVKVMIQEVPTDQQVSYCIIYADPQSLNKVDVYLEQLTSPRSFEWNLMHIPLIQKCCIDIDGVLCKDPTPLQNDDGTAYQQFLRNAIPLTFPSHKLGYLVTSRLEKYRKETEDWLHKNKIRYRKLHMLDLPDANTRRRLNIHASFKAQIFKSYPDSPLFIESDQNQALQITSLTGRPVLCFSNQKLYTPEFSRALMNVKIKSYHSRVLRKAKKLFNQYIPSTNFNLDSNPVLMEASPKNPDKAYPQFKELTEQD
ncbi:MAG: phosphoribosyltransferase family protein [Balneolales bacterium]